MQTGFWFQDCFSLSVIGLTKSKELKYYFFYYYWPLFLENEGHLEEEGVTEKYFQKESTQAQGIPRTHRKIVTFPDVI